MIAEKEVTVRFGSAVQRRWAMIGVLLALGWPFAQSLVIGGNGRDLTSAAEDVRSILLKWTVTGVLSAIAFGAQRLSPRFLRLRPFGWRDIIWMLGALLAAVLLSGIVSRLVAAPRFELRKMAAIPMAVRVGLVLTAAVCEEFSSRGFLIEELGALIGSRWMAAAASLIFFGLGHFGVYGFSTALLIPTSVGLMITLLYMWRGNLGVCMLMHAIMDALFLIVAPTLLAG